MGIKLKDKRDTVHTGLCAEYRLLSKIFVHHLWCGSVTDESCLFSGGVLFKTTVEKF